MRFRRSIPSDLITVATIAGALAAFSSVAAFQMQRPREFALGVCRVTAPSGYQLRVFNGNPLSARTWHEKLGGCMLVLKLTRMQPVPGADKAAAVRLKKDAKGTLERLPAIFKSIGDPVPKLTYHEITFRGHPALEQEMIESSPKRKAETYILKFIVSEEEYWISRSISGSNIEATAKARLLKDWMLFKDHLVIAGGVTKKYRAKGGEERP